MLTFELCKRLKDAGFTLPQPHPGASIVSIWKNKETGEEYIEPSLSELIEACGGNNNQIGDKFILWWCGEKWCAGQMEFCSENYVDDSDFDIEFGKSPEEAVTNLWLALNYKAVPYPSSENEAIAKIAK